MAPFRVQRLGSLARGAAVTALLGLLLSCGSGGRQLHRAPPALTDFIIVPRPPPVVPVEVQPPRPRPDAVWVEGQWAWEGGRWQWQRGGWALPPEGARLSVWAYCYRADGRVRFWPARWLNAEGQPIAAPATIEAAARSFGAR